MSSWMDITHYRLFPQPANINAFVVEAVAADGPIGCGLPLRTCGLSGRPVDREGRNIKPFPRLCLPACIGQDGPYDIDVVLRKTVDYDCSVHIAGIKQMNRRRQLTIRQGLVDWYGHSVVGNRCRGGFDVNDEMRGIIVACLRQMNLVPGPTRLALLAIVSIDIIG